MAGTAAGAAILVSLLLVLALLVKALYPADLPAAPNPDFVDNIFDSRAVIWAARLLLVSAAFVLAVGGVFIVGSIVIRMKNGDWLRRAGPFEVSENAVATMEGQFEFWRSQALAGQAEIQDLHERLGASDELVMRLRAKLGDGRGEGLPSGSSDYRGTGDDS